MDSLLKMICIPDILVEKSITRMLELWISPLKFSLGELGDEEVQSPRKKSRSEFIISLDPSIILGCLVSIFENLQTCMANWDETLRYTYQLEFNLEAKLTQEKDALSYLRKFRDALFRHKSTLLSKSVEYLKQYLNLVRQEQISRTNPKSLLKLRISMSKFYKDAILFSSDLSVTGLETEYEQLVDAYLDQTVNTQIDLIIMMVRTSDLELTAFDNQTFQKQLRELVTISKEFANEKWTPTHDKDFSLQATTFRFKSAMETGGIIDLQKLRSVTQLVQQIKSEHDSTEKLTLNQELLKIIDNLQNSEQSLQNLKMDISGGVVASFIITYLKLWLYFPEFKVNIKKRLDLVQALYYYFCLVRVLAPVSIQFLLSGGFNLTELNPEDSLPKLENFHDIVLFQKRFPSLRKYFYELNTSLE